MSISTYRRLASASLLLLAAAVPAGRTDGATDIILGNGGFESGLAAPWGTGQYSNGRSLWWNSSNCRSRVELDETDAMHGLVSLHIINESTRAPNVYGTTAQLIPIVPNQPYRITLWAQGLKLASRGAVTIVVDDAWAVRPIALPAGTYSWTRLSGTFSLPADHASIRILSEDAGEAWLDDITITPLESALY